MISALLKHNRLIYWRRYKLKTMAPPYILTTERNFLDRLSISMNINAGEIKPWRKASKTFSTVLRISLTVIKDKRKIVLIWLDLNLFRNTYVFKIGLTHIIFRQIFNFEQLGRFCDYLALQWYGYRSCCSNVT